MRRAVFRLRRLAPDLLVVALGILAAVATGEAIVRLVPRRWVPELAAASPQQRFYLKDLERESSDSRLRLELIPDNPRAQVNAAGYRGTLYPEKKPRGVRRIVGIGDSSMYGWGVREQRCYLRQLEALLQASNETVQVLNLAVPGYNSEQELEVLKERALRFDPDLVVLGYDHNDAEAYDVQTDARAAWPADYGENPLHSDLIRYLRRKFYSRVQLRTKPLPDSRVGLYLYAGPQWDRHLAALTEFARVARGKHIPVVVLVHDAYIQRENRDTSEHYQRLHVPLLAFWKQCGFHPVDSFDLLQDYMRAHQLEDMQSLWIDPKWHDFHPNPLAHRMLAEVLRDTIQEAHLLPSLVP